jgi:triacylglycerol lipase
MISQLKPANVEVLSLTTISTPHRGSAFADYMFETLGRGCSLNYNVVAVSAHRFSAMQVIRAYKALEYIGLETEAFSQLTRGCE